MCIRAAFLLLCTAGFIPVRLFLTEKPRQQFVFGIDLQENCSRVALMKPPQGLRLWIVVELNIPFGYAQGRLTEARTLQKLEIDHAIAH